MTIGEYIRSKREQLGISLRTMAKEVGISPAWLSRIETDKDHCLSRDTIEKIAAVLVVSEEDILFGVRKLPIDAEDRLFSDRRLFGRICKLLSKPGV